MFKVAIRELILDVGINHLHRNDNARNDSNSIFVVILFEDDGQNMKRIELIEDRSLRSRKEDRRIRS